eukprot:5935960-Pyramimonas_sp.AAC.1
MPQRHLPVSNIFGVAMGQSTRDLDGAVHGIVPGQMAAWLNRQHLLHAEVAAILEHQVHIGLAVQHAHAADDVWVVE